jgi:hypothetical protein
MFVGMGWWLFWRAAIDLASVSATFSCRCWTKKGRHPKQVWLPFCPARSVERHFVAMQGGMSDVSRCSLVLLLFIFLYFFRSFYLFLYLSLSSSGRSFVRSVVRWFDPLFVRPFGRSRSLSLSIFLFLSLSLSLLSSGLWVVVLCNDTSVREALASEQLCDDVITQTWQKYA